MKLILQIFLLTLITACSSTATDENVTDIISESPYKAEVYEKAPNDWGYRILQNDVPYIEQPHIPSIAGNKGFKNKQNAEITANFVIYKLKAGFMPPTVTLKELDSLNVLND